MGFNSGFKGLNFWDTVKYWHIHHCYQPKQRNVPEEMLLKKCLYVDLVSQ